MPISSLLQRGPSSPGQGGEPIRAIVVGPPDIAQPFINALPPGNSSGVEVVSFTRDVKDLLEDIKEYKPHIVLVSPNARDYKPDVVAQVANWPEGAIAVVGIVPTSGAWGSEMAAQGAVTFYNPPITPALVEKFAKEAQEIVDKARTNWRAPVVATGVSRNVLDSVAATSYRTGVIVFWSTKGGAGKTVLATEMACVLSQVGGKKTLLVDANMNAGHIAWRLGIKELADRNNIVHLANDYKLNGNQLTAQLLAQRVVKADGYLDERTKTVENRLDIVLGIPMVDLSVNTAIQGRQGEQFMSDLLRMARGMYEYVVVDCGSSINIGAHIGALNAADVVVFIVTDDVATLADNKQTMELLAVKYGIVRDRFKLVVNQYSSGSNVDLKDVARVLGLPVWATVPQEQSSTLKNCGNDGKSFMLRHLDIRKNSPEIEGAMRGLFELAEGLFPPLGAIIAARDEKIDGGKKGGWLGRKK